MTAGSDSRSAVAGGLARHIPVLGRAAVDFLRVRDAGIYVDATFGGGGYSREILAAADCTVIAIDRDPDAIAQAAELSQASRGRLVLAEGRFSELHRVVRSIGHDIVDGVVFDLGLSSLQLDDAGRGFSFRLAGPLDMRMGRGGPSAAELLACASEKDLTRILAVLGEERHARRIARAIVAARRSAPLRSTLALAELVARVVPGRPGAIHPATRTFQALRIFVNDELAELARGLSAAEEVLKAGGRLVVVAFHSLEDRMVKTFFAERAKQAGFSRHRPQAERRVPTFKLLLKRPLVPDDAEISANPRARSAKLRAAERTGAPPLRAFSPLPSLPSLFEITGRPR